MNNFKKILILAPHADDEISCAGSIAKFLEEGNEIYCVVFSLAEESIPEGFQKEILKEEFEKSAAILGIKKENSFIYRYPVRWLYKYRQEILEKLIDIKKKIDPDLIFSPNLNDIHQDHQTIAREALRAFQEKTILGYEKIRNNILFDSRCLIPFEEKHFEKKIKAAECYNSQKHRGAMDKTFLESLSRIRGFQVKSKYAEAFEVLRLILNK